MIRIIAVGKVKDRNLNLLCGEFEKRIRGLGNLEIKEVKDSRPEREAREMISQLGSQRGHQFVVAMDEHGDELDSKGLAKLLGDHGGISFLIGGADGLDQTARDRADLTLRLSRLTFTHEMARLLLCEQIYRGLSILAGKPYHRS